ncbi:DUF2911 domain-containing protein [Rubrolithibacter danxiaensis]|uniref:DUF2911 domain-containing protein n=1 Tax=Rubrolithibacter danxiaensis TaxID=3390805 RepID=UPI003BF78A16
MRKILLIALLSSFCFMYAQAQESFPPLDKSPADIAYFPANASFEKDLSKSPIIKVVYSRPHKNGREIFGVLEQYGKVWRAGANESTEIKFFKDVKLGDKKIEAGTYSLFAIPQKDNWTIIINKQTDKWGAYTYDEAKDVARVTVPVKKSDKVIEDFSIAFKDAPNGASMLMGWDQTIVEVPFTIL